MKFRHAQRRDENESRITDVLKAMKVDYELLDTPLDILFWIHGNFYFAEVKDPSQQWEYTSDQKDFLWRTEHCNRWVVEFPEEMEYIINRLRGSGKVKLDEPEMTPSGLRKTGKSMRFIT